jgi:hypothetical protein
MRQSFVWPVAYARMKWPHEIWSAKSELTPEVCLCWDWRPVHDINREIEYKAREMQEYMLNASEHEEDERETYLSRAFAEMADINVLYHERSLAMHMLLRRKCAALDIFKGTPLWRVTGDNPIVTHRIAWFLLDASIEPKWPESEPPIGPLRPRI